MPLSMLIKWRGELVCFTVCKFYLKKNAADRKCGAEGPQSMQSIVAEPSRGGR